jgi:hypothetical protein
MKTIDSLPPSWFQLLPSDDGPPCTNSRFFCVMNGEAVLDRETGLVWQQTITAGGLNWTSARLACRHATTGDRRGWRLASLAELSSLIDPDGLTSNPPAGHPFSGLPVTDNEFWTGEHLDGFAGAWAVRIGAAPYFITSYVDSTPLRVWCVRGPGDPTPLVP